MTNRLKGVTLVETLLYIGLFSVMMLVLLNFMLSTQEVMSRTNIRGELDNSLQFVARHINDSFEKAQSLDQENTTFDTDDGEIQLTFQEGDKTYTLSNNNLLFDGTPIHSSKYSVSKFNIEPVYKGESILIGVRVNITMHSKKEPSFTQDLNLLISLK